MGFIHGDGNDDGNTLPSLIAADMVQQQFLGAMDYVDDLCSHGAIDPDAVRPLRRCFVDWMVQQTRLMSRIEELEVELLTLEYSSVTSNSNTLPTKKIDVDMQNGEPKLEKRKKEYNVDKCKDKITPIRFISGGFINPPRTQTHTQTFTSTHSEHNTAQHTHLETHNVEILQPDGTSRTSEKENKTDDKFDSTDDRYQDKRQRATYDLDYKTLEENIKLSRLENPQTFQTALRLVTRLLHPKGAKICYPTAEQTDRLMLKAANIPTDGPGLCDLLRKACTRRGESFNLEATYKDLAKAHGRVYFDPTLAGPNCMVFTHYP